LLNQLPNTDEEDEDRIIFDRFKTDFFKALRKLSQMQEIADILDQDQAKSSKLAESIRESIKFVEESAYAKLVKYLKNKIKVFDTPLENQPDFLVFMKVTFKMLKEKSLEMYGHIMNELIKARAKYSELSFNEKINFIY
jgi:hypothetical protein